ncbi:hypothetical protein Hypma_001930 [Hypsizygus marmoreus]|uniref:F-box domain-containing protein n=1 Tax=Hypsizygus marmoreus TaxID=39966 RepID=A0A369J7B0_HYPMA|nr:hypothetical protein Hypma_001930 [Hypsizygus marmoreus]
METIEVKEGIDISNTPVHEASSLVFTDARIAREVVKYLASSPFAPTHDTRTNLLTAALTCKALRDPALDVIWESMDTLVPLLKLLPPIRLINGLYVFNEVLQDDHGHRFDLHAARVKQFTLGSDAVAPSTYVQLAQFRSRPLPALRRLYCGLGAMAPEAFVHWPLFVSPNITHIELNGFDLTDAHVIDPFLSSLPTCFKPSDSHLQHLVLCGQFQALSSIRCLARFSKLQSLEISEKINFDTLRELGTLEFLHELKITMPSSPITTEEEMGFRHLQNLYVTGEHSSVRSLLEHISTPWLESVTLVAFCIPVVRLIRTEVRSPTTRLRGSSRMRPAEPTFQTESINEFPAYDWWRPCFRILSSRWSHSLLKISISLSPNINSFPDPMELGLFHDIRPFVRLESLNFNNSHFAPNNDEIRALALACPELKDLRLSIGDSVSHSTSRHAPDIEALWALAELCPNLSFLKMGVDALSIPPFLTTKIMSHKLCRLSLGSLPETQLSTDQRMKIGRHLDRLFPWLEDVGTVTGYAADDWKRIWNLVQVYQLVRLDDFNRREGKEA